jgi:hypothetical protein
MGVFICIISIVSVPSPLFDLLTRNRSRGEMKMGGRGWQSPSPRMLLHEELLAVGLGFLSPADIRIAACASQSWRHLCFSDLVWRNLFLARFGPLSPPSPSAHSSHPEQSGLDEEEKDCREDEEEKEEQKVSCALESPPVSYVEKMRLRLLDPQMGDHVQVAWQGKFRIDSTHIFVGLSWWDAFIVDKAAGGYYKVHYHSWNSRWDEWVTSDRLRWASLTTSSLDHTYRSGDRVEVRCSGMSVVGVWLEARVHSMSSSGTSVCMSNIVLSEDLFWMPLTSVKLARPPSCRIARLAGSHLDPAVDDASNSGDDSATSSSSGLKWRRYSAYLPSKARHRISSWLRRAALSRLWRFRS